MNDTTAGLLRSSEGILFDFNGTLSDDEDLLAECYDDALQAMNLRALGTHEYDELVGLSEHDIATSLVRNRVDDARVVTVSDVLLDKFATAYRAECTREPRVSARTVSIIEELSVSHRLGIVTGTLRRLIEPVLRDLSIDQHFETVLTIEDVSEGKPAPDGFLLGARRLGLLPAHILVFEDSGAGVRAAKEAGMKVIGVGKIQGADSSLSKIEDLASHLS